MRLARCATLVACALISSTVQIQQVCGNDAEVRTIAIRGMPAPGVDAGSTFVNFGSATINQQGHCAFQASYSIPNPFADGDTGGPTLNGIWTNTGNNLTPVVHGSMPLPGFPTDARLHFGNPLVMNRRGDLLLSGTVREKGNPDLSGFWVMRHGSLELIARSGDAAPGYDSGVVFLDVPGQSSFFPALNQSGKIAFAAHTALASSPHTVSSIGLWEETAGVLKRVTHRDAQAPGFPIGYKIGDFHNPFLDQQGRTYFTSKVVSGDGLTHATTLWHEDAGTLAAIARAGQSFPGMAPGVVLGTFERFCINGAGTVVVSGPLMGPGITSLNRDGVCYGQPGQMQLVLQSGQPAVGFPDGYRFLSIGGSNYVRAISDSGEIAFGGSVSLPESPNLTERGVWQGVPGSLQLIARTNSTVPGVPGARFTSFFLPYLTAGGKIAFEGYITGGGASSGANNYEGFWGTNQSGQLKLLVRNGNSVEIAPGDSRYLQNFYYFGYTTGGGDGRGLGFDSHGRLLLHLLFSDGSTGLFTVRAKGHPA